MNKKSILIYFDNFPMITALPPEQRGWILTILMDYGERLSRGEKTGLEELMDQVPQLSSEGRLVCGFMGANIRRDTQRWLSRQKGAPARPRRDAALTPEERESIRRDMDFARRMVEVSKTEEKA